MKEFVKGFTVKDLLFIDRMITPIIITFLYWLGLIAVVLGALFSIIGGQIISGVLMIPFGLIIVRVYCELLLVIFKINTNLQKIADKE